VRIEGIPLTEGHSGLHLEVEDGIVKDGFYFALVPVRGFETLLIDKEAVVAPIITSRICGLCQVTHAIASARAVESVAGIEVPPEAELLREVLGLAVRIYNNLLHQIVISEDLFPDRDERFSFIKKVQKVRKFTGELLESVGGEIIHSPNIRVGGISEPLEDFVKEKILISIDKIKPLLVELQEEFIAGIEEMWKREGLSETLGSHNLRFFATDRFYGKAVDFNRISFHYPQELFEGELKREVTSLYPFIDGLPVETGPRARKVLFEGYKPKIIKSLYEGKALNIIDAYNTWKLLKKQNLNSDKIRAVFYEKVIVPLFALALMLILFFKMPFHARMMNLGSVIALSMGVTFAIWGVMFGLNQMGSNGVVEPEFTAILPVSILWIYAIYVYFTDEKSIA